MTQAELKHIYRAMKLMKDVIEESPELVNSDEEADFAIAWEIVNSTLIERYKDE